MWRSSCCGSGVAADLRYLLEGISHIGRTTRICGGIKGWAHLCTEAPEWTACATRWSFGQGEGIGASCRPGHEIVDIELHRPGVPGRDITQQRLIRAGKCRPAWVE